MMEKIPDNSSGMDLTCLLRNNLSLETSKKCLIDIFHLLFSLPRTEKSGRSLLPASAWLLQKGLSLTADFLLSLALFSKNVDRL